MSRTWQIIFAIGVVVGNTVSVGAQHHHPGPRNNNQQAMQQPVGMYPPLGYSGMGYGHHHGMPFVLSVYVAQPAPVVSYPMPIVYAPVFDPSFNLDKPPSTPASRLKSLDFQAKGDQKMREQKWGEARAAYASAISAAPDQADAHFKLAVCYVAIQRFDNAIREFKRAVNMDPRIVRTAKSMKALFGQDSQMIRTSIISKLGVWAKEDLHSADRLFLYGAMLRLDDDPRSRDILESAMKASAGENSHHIAGFLNPNAALAKDPGAFDGGLPVLNDQPAPLGMGRPAIDLRFPHSSGRLIAQDAPLPMPDAPVPIGNRTVPLPGAPVPMP